MAVTLYPRQAQAPKAGPAGVVSSSRKIALFGSHGSSLEDAPWDDPTWERWGHASAYRYYARPMHRYFDLHPKSVWTRPPKGTKYLEWLGSNTVPIYMQERYAEVPASIKYPKGRVLQEYGSPRPYFTNQVAWMIALALTEGVTTIGMWGVNYSARSEYIMQRGCAEYWLGRAAAQGVQIVLPAQCTLLGEPTGLYGYESHDETSGKLHNDYRKKQTMYLVTPETQAKQPAIPPEELAEKIAKEEEERPAWSFGPAVNE